MKKLRLLLSATAIFSAQAFAAPISIGPYGLDTDAGATSSSFTGSVFENTNGAITNSLVNTYIKGTSIDAAVFLNFENTALSNQNGNDLALFFITANNTVSVNINGINSGPITSRQLFVNDDPFVNPGPNGEKYLVTDILLPNGTLGTADLSVIFLDLNDFNVNLNQSINNIQVNLGNETSLMSYAIGLNAPVLVPLPAALYLFLSGLAGLGIFRHTGNI